MSFSLIQTDMARYEQETAFKAAFAAAEAFPDRMLQKSEVEKRKKRAEGDFWFFDKTYFPPSMYSDGYSKPSEFHKNIINIARHSAGVQIILAARKHGKTAIFKKYLIWGLMTGKYSFAGTLSATLPTSRNILRDVTNLISENPRIKNDFKPKFEEINADQITFQVPGKRRKSRVMAFSEGRSARGATHLFQRPQFILCDDLETRQSAIGNDHSIERIRIIREAFHSMSDGGLLVALGNNFDERCAMNLLLKEQGDGILPDNWRVWVYPAWDGKPLWKERYAAKTERELKTLLGVADEGEWSGDFQQKPTPPDGYIFSRHNLNWCESLPDDARGVIYCDPNLAKRGRGDSTAITSLLYSPSEDRYYIDDIVCKSFSSSNKLLDSVIKMKNQQHRAIGFDGNVAQESTWTNNIRLYCLTNKVPFPPVEYCRYKVDELAKNLQSVWAEGKVLINQKLQTNPDLQTYLAQLFAFAGKKANRADDAPDSLICAFELLHKRKLARRKREGSAVTVVNSDYF